MTIIEMDKRLKELLQGMDCPPARKLIMTEADLHWLGRNLAMNNPESPELNEARELLEKLGARLVL